MWGKVTFIRHISGPPKAFCIGITVGEQTMAALQRSTRIKMSKAWIRGNCSFAVRTVICVTCSVLITRGVVHVLTDKGRGSGHERPDAWPRHIGCENRHGCDVCPVDWVLSRGSGCERPGAFKGLEQPPPSVAAKSRYQMPARRGLLSSLGFERLGLSDGKSA